MCAADVLWRCLPGELLILPPRAATCALKAPHQPDRPHNHQEDFSSGGEETPPLRASLQRSPGPSRAANDKRCSRTVSDSPTWGLADSALPGLEPVCLTSSHAGPVLQLHGPGFAPQRSRAYSAMRTATFLRNASGDRDIEPEKLTQSRSSEMCDYLFLHQCLLEAWVTCRSPQPLTSHRPKATCKQTGSKGADITCK